MSANEQVAGRPNVTEWRSYLLAHGETEASVAAIEGALVDQVAALGSAGLDADEAFLVALGRVAREHALSRDFARLHAGALWSEHAEAESDAGTAAVVATAAEAAGARTRGARAEFAVMLGCAAAAAAAIKVPELFGLQMSGDVAFYNKNLSLFVLPFLAMYFIWKTGSSRKGVLGVGAVLVGGAVFVNAYPFEASGSTEALAFIHLPIVLWLAVGVAYAAGDWLSDERRMEYVRFTGEWLVNYALIALGGGVLVGVTVGVFGAIGLEISMLIQSWVLPCGAMGAVVVAAWLVSTRPSLIGGMAPMLSRVFTPLFAIMLVALLGGVLWTRGFINVEREVLILFDVLLVLVVALLLYGISARDKHAEPGLFDWIQLVLVGSALVVDVYALVSIAGRLAEYGFSPNKTAALGLNLILLVNLARSAFLQASFVRSRCGFESVERWQMRYVPVYALWAAVVVVVFPLVFGFI